MNEIVETAALRFDGMIAIDTHGATWMVLALPWWHPLTWFRWLAFLSHKRALLVLQTKRGKVRAEAVRLNRTHVRLGEKRRAEEAGNG